MLKFYHNFKRKLFKQSVSETVELSWGLTRFVLTNGL
jgi:hypothetical protein